jgi:hypothetical protein
MHGATLFDDAIRDAVDTSAIFIALTSLNYLRSKYCLKELSRFREHHGRYGSGLRVGNSSRIFTVLLNNIPHKDWPAPFKGTAGFRMHDAKSDDDRGDFISSRDDAFERQLRDIVDAVEGVIETQTTLDADTPKMDNPTDRVRIFLSDVPDSLEDLRERVATEIEHCNGESIADIPPPMDVAGHGDAVRQTLSNSQFSIHLLNQWPGRKIVDRKDITYPREQYDIAFELSLPQLVWVPPDLDLGAVEGDSQRQFLLACENRSRHPGQYEFVRCLPSELLNLVKERVDQFREPHPASGEHLSYLIDTHQKDQRYAFKLADLLLEKGAEVDFNHESRDPSVSLAKFEQSVKQVKNLILICGQVGPAWLIGRIKKAFKTMSEQFEAEDHSSLECIWLFIAPNSHGRPQLPPFPSLLQINVLDNSHSERIEPDIATALLAAGASQ